jgi:hypothetical protein
MEPQPPQRAAGRCAGYIIMDVAMCWEIQDPANPRTREPANPRTRERVLKGELHGE